MIACVDVHYEGDEGPAIASCVLYKDWDSSESHEERIAVIPKVAPYTAGRFYQRELPCILKVLGQVKSPLDAILVDGYVWLDHEGTPGLGAHLHRALGEETVVIGIAKNPFRDFRGQRQVCRGQSRKPLFITAIGIDADVAAEGVSRMHGAHRVPSLLARADQLPRDHASRSSRSASRRGTRPSPTSVG